jgi:hypothetical protein
MTTGMVLNPGLLSGRFFQSTAAVPHPLLLPTHSWIIDFYGFKQHLASPVVGTGGELNDLLCDVSWIPGMVFGIPVRRAREIREVSLDLPHRIGAIKQSLSLNMTQLARVLGVERPTVYSWIGGISLPQANNEERLVKLYSIARDWRRASSAPVGEYLSRSFDDGRSLLDWLSDADLNLLAIQNSLTEIRSQLVQSAQTSPRRRSVAEISRSHGFRQLSEQKQKELLRQEDSRQIG